MTDIEIEYCTECNYLPQALRQAEHTLKRHYNEIDSVRLVTGSGGVFKVRVNDEKVWDKGIDRFDVSDIEEAIRPKLEEATASA